MILGVGMIQLDLEILQKDVEKLKQITLRNSAVLDDVKL